MTTRILNKALSIEITWDDGMNHLWTPEPDGSWSLRLIDPKGVQTRVMITGYNAEDIARVVTTAVESNS